MANNNNLIITVYLLCPISILSQNFLQAVNYTSTIKGPSDEYEDMLSTITEQSDASSDEEERTWPQDHRIVSSSPAFMEFLAKVLETPI